MLLIHNTSFVYQLTPAAQRGGELGTLNAVPNGAVLLDGERILSVGSPAELLLQHPEADLLDTGAKPAMIISPPPQQGREQQGVGGPLLFDDHCETGIPIPENCKVKYRNKPKI